MWKGMFRAEQAEQAKQAEQAEPEPWVSWENT